VYCVRTVHDRDITKLWYVAEDIQPYISQETEKKQFEIMTPFGKQITDCVPAESVDQVGFWTVRPSANQFIKEGKMLSAKKFLLAQFCEFLDRNKIKYTCNVRKGEYVADVGMQGAVAIVRRHITHEGIMVPQLKKVFQAERIYLVCCSSENTHSTESVKVLQYCEDGKFRAS
jgi:hypothetical protein